MRVLVTGVKGQLGYDVCKRLNELGIANRGVDIDECDLTNGEQVAQCVAGYAPDCVVHCAAYTNVNQAESSRELCGAVNEAGTRYIAQACGRLGAKMLYVSTDYVFQGDGETPFEVDSPKNPQNVYGESKLAGERAVCETLENYWIVRTSWVYGKNGGNFVKTMLRLGREKERVQVVCDQIGSPTYTRDLAVLLCDMIQTESYGIFHATNEGFCSWYEFAKRIMAQAKLTCEVAPVMSCDYPSPVKRPLNSRLSKQSLQMAGFVRLPSWEDALRRYFVELERDDEE